MGGEKFHRWQRSDLRHGLPPRRRGKVLSALRVGQHVGITPAWAGKRSTCCCASRAPTDHPRMGGEKHLSGTTDNRPQGSPPHGRGKVRLAPLIQLLVGITPAWAGKRGRCCPDRLRCWDHPRAGREEQTGTVYAVLPYGSPPRGRGKVDAGIAEIEIVGITPAWAGKSWERTLPPSEPKDHPRMGGEKR